MTGADSAGVPWEGRSFHANPAAGDDGAAPPRLLEALRRFASREVGDAEVLDALRAVRLLVPLVAERGDEGVGAHGQLVDKTQELSMVTVAGPDGRPVLPAFTSVDTLRAWNAQARPIPVEAARIGLAAAAEGQLVVIDPASATEHVIRRPALKALATGERWTPSFADEGVLDAFLATSSTEAAVRALQLAPGDPGGRLAGPELLVQLSLAPGLDADALQRLLARLGAAWSADAVIAERVDSLGVRLERLD